MVGILTYYFLSNIWKSQFPSLISIIHKFLFFILKGQLYVKNMHFRGDQVKKFWSEVAGFAGCIIIRRYVEIQSFSILPTEQFFSW